MIIAGIILLLFGWQVIVAFGNSPDGKLKTGDLFGAALVGAGTSTCLLVLMGILK